MVDHRKCRRILAMLSAFEDATIRCTPFGASDLQSVVRGIVPGFNDVCNIQSLDAGAGVTESSDDR